MPHNRIEQQIRLVPRSDLGRDVAAFLIDRAARSLSPGTVEYYRNELSYLQAYLEGHGLQRVEELTANHLRQYLVALGHHRNPGGVHAAYRAIRAFCRWYQIEYEPQGWTNPMTKVSAPRVVQEPLDPVAISDLSAMLATCERRAFAGDRDRALLLAFLDTGCRASEFVSLDVSDVNLGTGAVIIRKGKGGKFRTSFVGVKTRRELLRYLRHHTDDEGPLWLTRDGHRLKYAGLRQIVNRRAHKAGVPVPSLHSFRRAFALLSLRAGMDVYSLQRLMGHSDLSILRRYLAQTEGDLQKAHARAGPVDNLL